MKKYAILFALMWLFTACVSDEKRHEVLKNKFGKDCYIFDRNGGYGIVTASCAVYYVDFYGGSTKINSIIRKK